jgi:hypothetical protein
MIYRIKCVVRHVYFNADTSTIRLVIALASLLWSIELVLNSHISTVPGMEYLFQVAGRLQWAAIFLAHFIGICWRFVDPKPRVYWALLINAAGFMLWSMSTFSVIYDLRSLTPGTSVELVICIFAGWALYRTGLRGEIVTP